MGVVERYRQFCRLTIKLTGIHATLMDVRKGRFACPPFYEEKNGDGSLCNAYNTHLYGAYQALSKGGWYIYVCPRGLTFISIPFLSHSDRLEYCLTIGPIISEQRSDHHAESCHAETDTVITLPETKIRNLAEWIEYAAPERQFSRKQIDFSMFGDITEGVFKPGYSIDTLKLLFQAIRRGDKESARQELFEIEESLYSQLAEDYNAMRWQVIELFIRMSRAAIKGGAEKTEVVRFCIDHLREADEIRNEKEYNKWLQSALSRFLDFVFDLKDTKHQNIIFRTKQYIIKHMSEKITLEEAAANVFISRTYLSKIIKEELGYPFTEMVNRLRVEKAKQRLNENSLTIAQIAAEVGFADQSYFTKVFKNIVGSTPEQFRKAQV